MENWIPYVNRSSEPEQRIHEEFTDKAENRISFAVNNIAYRVEIQRAYEECRAEIGLPFNYFETANTEPAKESLHKFIKEEEFEHVLTILELIINEIWVEKDRERDNHGTEELLEFDELLRRILIEQGILLQIKPEREKLESYAESLDMYRDIEVSAFASRHGQSKPTKPEKDFNIRFEPIANESVIEADQVIRALGKEERWAEQLKPYNEAWEQYQKQNFSTTIPEKLYNSLEAVLEKICVEEDWNNSEDSVGDYLTSLHKHGVFEPNEAMIGEWQEIVSGIGTGVQRSGGDRKGHGNIDQDYCILLIHQIAAFLTFVIQKYESRDFE
jgi:hypothetical protein